MPAAIIMKIGWTLVKKTAQNAATHKMTLQVISYVSVPKFAPFIRSRAADAISPTTTGLSPINIPFITADSRCLLM